MATALEVARYLVHLAAAEDEPELLTHLRLQKLLYYTQGWSLALRGKAMFQERIEAWAHGPVVRDVYGVFQQYGNKPIPSEEIACPGCVDDDDAEMVGSVWEAYKKFTAGALREMTHNEDPWRDARRGLEPAARCDREITQEAMKAFFASRA